MKKYKYKTITTTIINGVELYKFDQKILNKEIIKRKIDGYDYNEYYYGQEYVGLSFEDAINMLGEDGWDLVMEKEGVGIVMKKELEVDEFLEKEMKKEKEEIKKEKEVLKKEKNEFMKRKESFEKEKEDFSKKKEAFKKEKEELEKQKQEEKNEEIKKIKLI